MKYIKLEIAKDLNLNGPQLKMNFYMWAQWVKSGPQQVENLKIIILSLLKLLHLMAK